MLAIDRHAGGFLYRQVIDLIAGEIVSGTLTPGQRLPSLRRLSGQLGVSIPTVKQAYLELERQGRVAARPQSGFYVRHVNRNALVQPACSDCEPSIVRCRNLIECVYEGVHRPGVVPLGIANPSMARPAAKALHRTMKRVMARAEKRSLDYAPFTGEPALRRQIANRYLEIGGKVDPDEITVTNGGQEALALALMAVTQPGDVVAVESPTYHGALELIESLGLLALEIETCARDGVSMSALALALERHPIKACLFASAMNNPLGSCTSDGKREALVEMLESRGVPLVEDDVYGELRFDGIRPRPAQVFSRRGLVLTCGSFSKTVAPGYRIGWLAAGRFRAEVQRRKRALSCSSGLLQQLTLSEFLASGDYDRHLRALRPELKRNAERMSGLIADHFPAETRVSQPCGGSVLWLELPRHVNSRRLFERALEEQISIAPGEVFSPAHHYKNCIRLSFGHPWDERIERAVERLAGLTVELGE